MRCGLPFASPHALDSADAECGECRRDEPGFDVARCFGLYIGNLRKAILRLKFAGDERLGGRLGELLAFPWKMLPNNGDSGFPLIVAVPLHTSRRRERGYNQSQLLAAGLARALKRTTRHPPQVLRECLRRKRATPPQTGLSVAARRENVRGVFEVVNSAATRGRRIVVVDDVMTTGATISACARALRRAGATQVLALVLARATPQFPDLSSADRDNTVDGLDWDWT